MWVKIDDKMHAHRKTRRVVTSDATKRRDAAPMGLWLLAASWAGQNGTGGWVPEHELDRWDDNWEALAKRLTRAEFWWPEERDDEPGYGFVDWEDYNPASGSSEAGKYGNHERWHVKKGVVKPGCPHCPIIPDDIDDPDPESGGDIGGRSGGDIAPESRNIALPDPTRPDPDPKDSCSTDVEREHEVGRFDEWWDTYAKKTGRAKCEKKWKSIIGKRGVTADLLIGATRRYIASQQAKGDHPTFTKDPLTWLNGQHWEDEVDAPQQQQLAGLPTIAEVRRMQAEREARERGQTA